MKKMCCDVYDSCILGKQVDDNSMDPVLVSGLCFGGITTYAECTELVNVNM